MKKDKNFEKVYLFSIQKLLHLLKQKGPRRFPGKGGTQKKTLKKGIHVNDDFVILNNDRFPKMKQVLSKGEIQQQKYLCMTYCYS